jgi:hypothetical protein
MIEKILNFLSNYSKIHGWLSMITCLIGILLNIINIKILTRSKFKTHYCNSIFISIALFNSITMITYLPYTIHYYIINQDLLLIDSHPKRDTLFWTSYAILSTIICLTTHSISIWLTVYLSIYRYITIKKQSINSLKYHNLIILLIILFCIFISIPSYLYPDILKQNSTSNDSSFVYLIRQSDLNIQTNNLIFKLSFYTQAIPAKIIPCCLLSIFIPLIIYNLIIINKKKQRLLQIKTRMIDEAVSKKHKKVSVNDRSEKNNHKTIMLVSVCLLLLIAELPQAILLLCSIFSDYIYWSFYKPLGDLLDILVFITYPIDFFIYCSMSELFRKEFCLLFKFKF